MNADRTTVGDIAAFIDEIAPFKTALTFDNVGLLVGDGRAEVTGILVALDITISALNAALDSGCNLIVCHHPVIYKKLSNVTDESIVYDLIKAGISVIVAHTNLDLAENGVNHALAEKLGLANVAPFENSDNAGLVGSLPKPMDSHELAIYIKEALAAPTISYVGKIGEIRTVAVLGGAGEDYLYDSMVADAYITGEVPHHIYCYAQNAGIRVFAAGHYATEVVVLPVLSETLSKRFDGIKVSTFAESGISYQ